MRIRLAAMGKPEDGASGPPRLFYGWVIVLALCWTEVTSWGILYYAFPVFVTPMSQELGWSRAAITGAFSLALLCSGLAALVVGRWVDRHGPRLIMTAGSGAAALLVLAWASVDDLAVFYLVWAGIGLASAAVLYEPAFVAVATWFVRYRGRALTILTFAGGFASVVYLPLTARLVDGHGWRAALVVLAILLATLTMPVHGLVLRRRPEDLGLLPDGGPSSEGDQDERDETRVSLGNAVRSASFRWLTTAFCLAFLVNVAMTVHLIPFLTERGFGGGFAATAAGGVGLMALPGRLVFTPLGGCVPRRYVTAAIFLLQSLGIAALVMAPTRGGVVAFVVLFGAGFGAITPARAALVAELYGRRQYGGVSGVLALFVTVARAAGPVAAGALYGVWGRYEPVLWLLIAVAVAAAGSALLIEDGR